MCPDNTQGRKARVGKSTFATHDLTWPPHILHTHTHSMIKLVNNWPPTPTHPHTIHTHTHTHTHTYVRTHCAHTCVHTTHPDSARLGSFSDHFSFAQLNSWGLCVRRQERGGTVCFAVQKMTHKYSAFCSFWALQRPAGRTSAKNKPVLF